MNAFTLKQDIKTVKPAEELGIQSYSEMTKKSLVMIANIVVMKMILLKKISRYLLLEYAA